MDIPGLRVFQSLLKAEQNVMSAAVTLSQMAARGAHGRDFDFLVNQYREQKTALYGREMFLYNQLINFINTGNAFDNINIVARYSREYIISLIPRPQLLPDIPTQPTAASRSGRSGTSGLSGPEIVIAGVAINPWVAILLAIVVIAVIIWS